MLNNTHILCYSLRHCNEFYKSMRKAANKKYKEIPLFKVFMPYSVDRKIVKTLHSGYISSGERVKEFEKAIGKFLGNPYAVPVSSCTMALTIAYELANIQQSDEVISTPLTCIATNVPLVRIGAKIVWADCEPKTGMVDPGKIVSLITKKTRAIVVLHKDGDLAKMDEILAIAKKYKLKVIEDAAHVFGAKYKGKMVGNFGDYTCFSFQAIKHITTGDGGALVCKNETDYKKAKKLLWFGLDKEAQTKHKNVWMNDIAILGHKGNMNDIAATIGLEQIKHVYNIVKRFHNNGELYTQLLQGVPGVSLIERNPENYSIYWVYTLLVENRDEISKALEKEGITSSVIHPRNDIYSVFKSFKKTLPGVDYYSARELSLPCGWWVTKKDIKRIVDIIKKNTE